MMENRSFDHYYGARKLVEDEASNGLSGDESNPNYEGEEVPVYVSTEFEPKDPPHGWEACHFQFNLGDNNGSALENQKANPGFEHEAMSYHLREHLPAIYDLADNFHVAPPETINDSPTFEQLGLRVPSLVVGPSVRRGCVNSTQLELVSVLTTIARRFGLPWLNERHEKAADLSSCIHPDYVDDPQPPPKIRPLTVSIAEMLQGGGEKTSQEELFAALRSPSRRARREFSPRRPGVDAPPPETCRVPRASPSSGPEPTAPSCRGRVSW